MTEPAPAERGALKVTDELFAAGLFAEARAQYEAGTRAAHCLAALQLGAIALLGNALQAARPICITRSANKRRSRAGLLAALCYRCGDYREAAAHFATLSRQPLASKLAAFTTSPYRLEGPSETVLDFVVVAPGCRGGEWRARVRWFSIPARTN